MSEKQQVNQKSQQPKPVHLAPEISGEQFADSTVPLRLLRACSFSNLPHHPTARKFQQAKLLDLQKRNGNATVQRVLGYPTLSPAVESRLVQRQAGGFAPGKGIKFSPPGKSWNVDRPMPVVPIKLSKIKLDGEISASAVEQGEDANAQVGMVGEGGGHAGVYGELTKEWDKHASPIGEVTVQSKAEAKVTTNGGEIGLLLLGAKTKNVAIGLKFNLLSYDREESEIEFANLSVPVDIIPITGETTTPDGTRLNYEIKATITLVFTPDYVKIGKWIGEKLAEEAAAELALTGGIILAGFATIAAGLVTASLGGEVAERVDKAVRLTNEFCAAYQATMVGSGDWSTSSEFGYKGEAVARGIIKKSEVPKEAFYEAAKKRNLRGEAFAIAWPQVKSMMLSNYREEHWFEWEVYGEEGPGYRILKRLLDPANLNF